MNPRLRRAAVLLGLFLVPGLVIGVPAMARDNLVRETTSASDAAALLAPGISTTRQFEVRNTLPTKATLFVLAYNIRDDDNGCNRPEARDGDTSCGSGGGELSRWIKLSVHTGDSHHPVRVWTGKLFGFRYGAVVVPGLAKNSTTPIRIVTSLPREAGNDTQTDRITYDLKWVLVSSFGTKSHSTTIKGSTQPPGRLDAMLTSVSHGLGGNGNHAVVLVALAAVGLPLRVLRSRSARQRIRRPS